MVNPLPTFSQSIGECLNFKQGRRSVLMARALIPRASGLGSSPDQGHHVVFYAKHLTLTMRPSTQEYKWVPANC